MLPLSDVPSLPSIPVTRVRLAKRRLVRADPPGRDTQRERRVLRTLIPGLPVLPIPSVRVARAMSVKTRVDNLTIRAAPADRMPRVAVAPMWEVVPVKQALAQRAWPQERQEPELRDLRLQVQVGLQVALRTPAPVVTRQAPAARAKPAIAGQHRERELGPTRRTTGRVFRLKARRNCVSHNWHGWAKRRLT